MLPGCFESRLSSFLTIPGNTLLITESVKPFGGIVSGSNGAPALSELLFVAVVVVHDDKESSKKNATVMVKK
jgi:hypothetical protein